MAEDSGPVTAVSFEVLQAEVVKVLRHALADRMSAAELQSEATDVVIVVMTRLTDRSDAGDPVANPVGYAVHAARNRAADVRRGPVRETRRERSVRDWLAENYDSTVAGATGPALDAAADALGIDRAAVRAMGVVARDRSALYSPDGLDSGDKAEQTPAVGAGGDHDDELDDPLYRVATATLDVEDARVDGYPVSMISTYLELWRSGRLTDDPVRRPWQDAGMLYPSRARPTTYRNPWQHLAREAPGLRQWALTEWIAYPTAKTMVGRYVDRLGELHREWTSSTAVEREDLTRGWEAVVEEAQRVVGVRRSPPRDTRRLAEFEPPPEWDMPLTMRLRGAKLHHVWGTPDPRETRD